MLDVMDFLREIDSELPNSKDLEQRLSFLESKVGVSESRIGFDESNDPDDDYHVGDEVKIIDTGEIGEIVDFKDNRPNGGQYPYVKIEGEKRSKLFHVSDLELVN